MSQNKNMLGVAEVIKRIMQVLNELGSARKGSRPRFLRQHQISWYHKYLLVVSDRYLLLFENTLLLKGCDYCQPYNIPTVHASDIPY